MTREQHAAMLLQGQAGLDQGYDDAGGGVDSFGADDPISQKGLSTLIVTLSVANAAALSVNLFDQADSDAAALPTGVTSPVIAGYKKAIRYFMSNPSQVRSILIQSSESGSAPVLSSMQLVPTRSSPFGLSFSNSVYAQSYQTTQDYQAGRITIPLTATLDGFSYLQFTTGTNSSGATVTFNVTFLIGRRAEIRKQITGASPVVIRPGGRGPASIK